MKNPTMQEPMEESGAGYRFTRLTSRMLMDDFRFGKTAAAAGDPLPEAELAATDGRRINTRDYAEGRPLLLIFGSLTCPMTVSSDPSLKRLHAEFGDKIRFLTLYVREAHPGENFPQPESLEEKLEHARALKEMDQIPWTVAADDIDGTLHRALDTKPNAAYLIDTEGKIVFRALWAGDERSLRKALKSLAQGRDSAKRESRAMLGPMAKAMGNFQAVLRRAGRQAERDILRAMPPIAVAGRIATLFRPLSPQGRGAAAMVTLGSLAAAAGWAALRWLG